MRIFIGDDEHCLEGIWINEEFCICTNKLHSKWHRFWLSALLGWRIEKRKPHQALRGLSKN